MPCPPLASQQLDSLRTSSMPLPKTHQIDQAISLSPSPKKHRHNPPTDRKQVRHQNRMYLSLLGRHALARFARSISNPTILVYGLPRCQQNIPVLERGGNKPVALPPRPPMQRLQTLPDAHPHHYPKQLPSAVLSSRSEFVGLSGRSSRDPYLGAMLG